ncbi:hypothetical protein C5167_041917, partial [Papaver somniferum]
KICQPTGTTVDRKVDSVEMVLNFCNLYAKDFFCLHLPKKRTGSPTMLTANYIKWLQRRIGNAALKSLQNWKEL